MMNQKYYMLNQTPSVGDLIQFAHLGDYENIRWFNPFKIGTTGLVSVKTRGYRVPLEGEWFLYPYNGSTYEKFKAIKALKNERDRRWIVKLIVIRNGMFTGVIELHSHECCNCH